VISVPTVPVTVVALFSVGRVVFTVRVIGAESTVTPPPVALIVSVVVPKAVGVPETIPVDELRLSPTGRVPVNTA
jgi:hypothetical protein